ncbi:hypothetical protein GCM10009096_10910 [Parasphingorhabdus litoris]|uniref:Uncharacterized protein n=1 Tax=Parasphingorhabdus litoris TaxID=394733 RepID=A0ABN1AAJ6_9SPHN
MDWSSVDSNPIAIDEIVNVHFRDVADINARTGSQNKFRTIKVNTPIRFPTYSPLCYNPLMTLPNQLVRP